MKVIRDKYDKKEIQNLPRVLFEGRIIVVFTERDADKAVDYLMKQELLGFDTETRPSFKKGLLFQVALLQVATHDTCFLFRLNRIGLPDSIIRLLEDRTITKVGLSLQDDLRQLHARHPFETGTFVELQHEVKEIGIEDNSLQKIYANLFGQKISKGQQLTNWEAEILTEAQQRYAATDAWACIQIHQEVARMKREQDFRLEKTQNDTYSQ
ncbi:MAG: 3'-5' exonuclease domain-containing protein 2 [Bacteroidaceae bacterium]|jgi:ribonuclease D|nr:3'-5' exonuclease domain-containing protein 2 [Bacteroidaceae bacterium]